MPAPVQSEPVGIDIQRGIEDFLADYAHCVDDGEFERWPDFFTDDALYRVISRESYERDLPIGVMHCKGRGMFADRIRALRRASIFEPHVYCHILSTSRLTRRAENVYAARTNVHVLRTLQDGTTDTFATGKYVDEIVATDGGYRFRRREVVLDSRRIEILLVLPL